MVKQSFGWDHPEESVSADVAQPSAVMACTAAETFRMSGEETILLVEDESFIRQALRETLESAGYNVLIAASATEAKAAYWQHPDSVHLLLADFVLPGMTGGDLAQELGRACPTMRVLLMSGYAQLRVLGKSPAHDNGKAPEWISKPFSTPSLLKRIRETLDGYSSAKEISAQARLA